MAATNISTIVGEYRLFVTRLPEQQLVFSHTAIANLILYQSSIIDDHLETYCIQSEILVSFGFFFKSILKF